jgi:hypothetical protein
MTKKPKVVASYGDPRKPRRWAAKRIRQEFANEILEAAKQPPEIAPDEVWTLEDVAYQEIGDPYSKHWGDDGQ